MSSQKWLVLDTGKSSAERNMAIDAELLDQMAHDQKCPILHLYDWEAPSATYGHFIDPSRFVQTEVAARLGLHLARRPTGGGMIFHLTDLAFSIVMPANHPGYSVNVLNNYAFVNNLVIKAIKKFTQNQTQPHLLSNEPLAAGPVCKHFCMAKPTKYDIMLEGRKVGGGAQRRTMHGFLHQGSISLTAPSIDFLNKILLPNEDLIAAMQATTYALVSGPITQEQLRDARHLMNQLLSESVNTL